MQIESVMRFATAAHYSYLVESPFRQRGGILLAAGPGSLKSTIVKNCIRTFPNALGYGDLTLKQLAVIRNQISNGMYHTLGFYELEKIYARQQSVAMNFEGVIKAMVEEGFSHFAFEDQRCWVPTARCFVFASVLDNLYRYHFPRWTDNGFLRRFIVIKYFLSRKSQQKMKDAIHRGEQVPLPSIPHFVPTGTIKEDCSREESMKLADLLGNDDIAYTPMILMRKSLTLLKWHRKQTRPNKTDLTPLEIIVDMKDCIGPHGGVLEI